MPEPYLRPFCHLIKGYKKGFKILTADSAEFEGFVKAVCAAHGRISLSYTDYEEFTQLRVGIDGQPDGALLARGSMTAAMAHDYWKRIREAGLIDFANILYYSYLLLEKRPEIRQCVASKFAWILVDEFQDTNEAQMSLVRAITQNPVYEGRANVC
ncbi:MAG: UvrD-helicase domain-containing protein, partial [Terricaulis sp.]